MEIENTWQHGGGSDDLLNKMLQQTNFHNIQSKLPFFKEVKEELIDGNALGCIDHFILYHLVLFHTSMAGLHCSLCDDFIQYLDNDRYLEII